MYSLLTGTYFTRGLWKQMVYCSWLPFLFLIYFENVLFSWQTWTFLIWIALKGGNLLIKSEKNEYIYAVNKYFGVIFVLYDCIKFVFLPGKTVSTLLTLSLGYSALSRIWGYFETFFCVLVFQHQIRILQSWFCLRKKKKAVYAVVFGLHSFALNSCFARHSFIWMCPKYLPPSFPPPPPIFLHSFRNVCILLSRP